VYPGYSAKRPCRTIGCEDFTEEGSDYCPKCNELRRQKPPPRPVRAGERDVEHLLLREAIAGSGPHTRRVRKQGTHPCRICEGPSLPGRLYCSDICRARARRGEAMVVEIDGIKGRPIDHMRRLGVSEAVFYKRLRKGLSVREALTRPIDREMRRRAMCK
jgi:hypothetical protein